MKRILQIVGAISFALIIAFATASRATAQLASNDKTDWREEYAYTLGVQAYIYAFPLIYDAQLRYDWSNVPESSFYASLNHFHHKKVLSNHINYTSGGSPNQDTLYSWGWIDLRDGPVILSHPEMGDRYFTFEIADFFSDNFSYVGKRTTGGKASAYAIVPPKWSGELPNDIDGSFQSPTTYVLVFGRTLVDDEADIKIVNALQDQYHMTPIAYWGTDKKVPEKRDVFKPYDKASDPLADWRTINRAWSENPLPADRDPDLVTLFAEIGIGPEFSAESIDDLPDPIKRGLARAALVAREMLERIKVTGAYKSKIVNGWNYPPVSFGRAGLFKDFLTRASVQSLGGIIANDPEEAVYLNTFFDVDGKLLGSEKKYTIQIDAGKFPPVNEFWSLTMYDASDQNFVSNDIMRYSVGDRTLGMVKDADGNLIVYVQPDPPESESERANWLPSPAKGNFYLVLRAYVPKQPLIDQKWKPPTISPVK